jgi:hypothetical protein
MVTVYRWFAETARRTTGTGLQLTVSVAQQLTPDRRTADDRVSEQCRALHGCKKGTRKPGPGPVSLRRRVLVRSSDGAGVAVAGNAIVTDA